MKNPTPADCHPDNCSDSEQQLTRIIRLWLNDPDGQFDFRQTNRQRLCSSLEYRIQAWFKCSSDKTLHEYWSDGIHLKSISGDNSKIHFEGISIYSDRHCNHMWLAPIDIKVFYAYVDVERPSSVQLRFGLADDTYRIARLAPKSWSSWQTDAAAILERVVKGDSKWAVELNLDPYPNKFRS